MKEKMQNSKKDDPFEIAGWIAKSMAGELSEKEEKLLEDWKMVSPGNRQLYDRVVDQETRSLQKERFHSFDKVVGWQGYVRKLERQKRSFGRWRVVMRYAAVLIVPLGVAIGLFLLKKQDIADPNASRAIDSGENRVELVLATGEVVDLTKESGKILKGENTVIKNEGNTLSFENTGMRKIADTVGYNEVIVPAGGEYKLVLGDGTVVYLNSMTKIRFPEYFSRDIREVEVVGEAFFEVMRNEGAPFVVRTGRYDVTVLGTRFNVTAYAGDNVSTTTLVEGRVLISGDGVGESMTLLPNEQLVLNCVSGSVEVKTVDVSYATAWKDGMFRFRDERLEEIMRVVERWYGVEVKYEKESLKDLRFGFNMSRHETVDPVLQVFELNGKVKIVREGKVLIVKEER